jgi:hypothetical protein
MKNPGVLQNKCLCPADTNICSMKLVKYFKVPENELVNRHNCQSETAVRNGVELQNLTKE